MMNRNGVNYLASRVVEQAYEDYISSGKRMVSIKDPFRSKNTFRMFNVLFNEKVYAKTRSNDGAWSSPRALYLMVLEALKEDYYKYAMEFIEVADFFRSDRLLLFTKKLDGEFMLKKMNEDLKEWTEGGSYSKRIQYSAEMK